MTYPHCQSCGEKNEEKLHVQSRRTLKSGEKRISYMCNACQTARHKKYRQTPEGAAAAYRSAINYQERNREKQKAWIMVRDHRLKAKPCAVCAKKGKNHAHHKDYDKPLKVTWLCPLHHKREHMKLRKSHA